ncbi:hypothetical protein XA68_10607 [Ophiocordyceps unilateralis]|uniref:Uncharacterized protein n=1 Tax=Ophiocordyceps unilateralis TaxID=268505 RepID=A0A2A9PID4_OPHUN|nr:hypothetical protein XA68_10607 [Ophiocordyceps unilateralis]
MKLVSLILALGLAAFSLAAPIPAPRQLLAMDDRPVLRNPMDSLTALFAPLRILCWGPRRLRPVFDIDKESSEYMTDMNGDLLLVGTNQKLRIVGWNPSPSLFILVPRGRQPVAILVVCLWLLATCWYLARSFQDTDDAVLVLPAQSLEQRRPTPPPERGREKSAAVAGGCFR